ncbi:MAG: ABC transporter ATP-binding protein [Halofilum sp. (in: g-proteobacteria)]|nr:ABC transporter ATP-binding protein [Halofilum sp. (in: g-proteobacteria)]
MSGDQAALELNDVSYGYLEAGRHHVVLHEVALDVAAGETVAIVGRSGAGKSTLLNLIGGLAPPESGRIRVGGHDLATLGERGRTLLRRRHIGFVYQFFNLIDTLDVEDNVLLPLELDGGADAAGRERARQLLAEVGLADRARARPDRLSGGEQQRVAVVRALAHRPGLVLADEPTGNLDAETGEAVLALLDRLVRRGGHSLVLVTHSDTVAGVADRVLRLADGRLAAA